MRIRLRGRDVYAAPEIISDPVEVTHLLEQMATASPTVKRFVAVPQDAGGHFDRQRLQSAIDYGFRIIRWHPTTSPDHRSSSAR